ncbi:MAG: hypothetical protein JSR97_10325 [Verrucomicrobia bacterium]|nr:hypothetical protein [Verrucomicrobiota bacterium]
MKKLTVLLLLLFHLSAVTNAQITIRNENIIEKPVLRPKSFDSLSNISMQKRFIDYKKFIGYKLFFIPKAKNYKSEFSNSDTIITYLFSNKKSTVFKSGKISFEEVTLNQIRFKDTTKLKGEALKYYRDKRLDYEKIDQEETYIYKPKFYYSKTEKIDGKIYGKIGTDPDSIEGKYFTILDIKMKESSGKEFINLEDMSDSDPDWLPRLKIYLKNDATGDSLYYQVQQARLIDIAPFFLVPYFEKQKNTYLNRNLVSLKNISNLVDINSGETVNIQPNEVWHCSEVSFADSRTSPFLTPFYYLKYEQKEIALPFGYFHNQSFILESEFLRREEEKKKKEEERVKEEQERERSILEEKKNFRNSSIARFGQKTGNLIADGKVLIGMNQEMCKLAWGVPIDINRTIIKGLTREQWVYGWGTYLYFDNGVLSAIQN